MFQRQQISSWQFSPEHAGGLSSASVKLFLPAVYFLPSDCIKAAIPSRKD